MTMEKEPKHEGEVVEQGEVPKGVKLALWGAALLMVVLGLVATVMYD